MPTESAPAISNLSRELEDFQREDIGDGGTDPVLELLMVSPATQPLEDLESPSGQSAGCLPLLPQLPSPVREMEESLRDILKPGEGILYILLFYSGVCMCICM